MRLTIFAGAILGAGVMAMADIKGSRPHDAHEARPEPSAAATACGSGSLSLLGLGALTQTPIRTEAPGPLYFEEDKEHINDMR